MNRKIIFLGIVIMLIIIMILPSKSFCIDTGAYKDIYEANGEEGSLFEKGGKILGIVQVAGIGIAAIMLAVIGIRFFMASPQEKADIKEKLTPYVIGAVLLFGATSILSLIVKFVREF